MSLNSLSIVAQEAFISPRLEKIWTTPDGLNVPESSYYNSGDKIIYVSNIVGMHNIKDGIGYISDSGGNCRFYIGKNSLEVFLESDQLEKMNGILAYQNLLFLGSKYNFISVNQKTKTISNLAEKVGYLDGIEMVGRNKFITSDFQGKVQLIEPGKGVENLMNTTEIKVNAADLGFIPSQYLLLVPTFYGNKVIAFKLRL